MKHRETTPHPWSEKLSQIILVLFAALFFFIPLVVHPKTSELFEFNKMMLTYLFTIGITTTWITKAILNRQLKIRRTPLDIPLLLFLASQIVTTTTSIDPHTSLWGYYSRFHGGLLSTISYFLLFYAFVSNIKKSQLNLLVNTILGSSLIVCLYAIAQHFGIDAHIWVQDVQNRVFSTLGQPNWLSAYLVAILPIPIFFSLTAKDKKRLLIHLLLSSLIFISILFTKSRSGIGTTFLVLLTIFAIYFTRTLKEKQASTQFKTGLLSLATVFLSFTLILGTPWTPTPNQFIHRLDVGGPLLAELEPYFNQLKLTTQVKPLDTTKLPPETQESLKLASQGIRVGGSDSFDIRSVVWRGATDLFKRKPLVGTGLETFGYSYYWTRPAAHNNLSEWEFLYNKAHNEYLNTLATTGLVGTLPYAILIISIGTLFLRSAQFGSLSQALTLGWFSILITNFFGFSVVPVAIPFFLFPGLLIIDRKAPKYHYLGSGVVLTKKQSKSIKKGGTYPTNTIQALGLSLVLITGTYFAIVIIRHHSADLNYNKAKQYNQAGLVGQALPFIEKAVKLYPQEPTFRSELAKTYANAALALDNQLGSPETPDTLKTQIPAQRDNYTQLALDTSAQIIADNPWHLNFYRHKAQSELTLAEINPEYEHNALNTLLKANEIAPTDAKTLYHIGLIYLDLKQTDRAQTAFEKALDLKPDYSEARAELINLINETDPERATKELKTLLRYIPDHPFAEKYAQLLNQD